MAKVIKEAVTDFRDEEAEPAPRGREVEDDIQAIRDRRAADRAKKGTAGKPRRITNYHDAERLRNLGLLSPEEQVDCEEAGYLDVPPPPPGTLPGGEAA